MFVYPLSARRKSDMLSVHPDTTMGGAFQRVIQSIPAGTTEGPRFCDSVWFEGVPARLPAATVGVPMEE